MADNLFWTCLETVASNNALVGLCLNFGFRARSLLDRSGRQQVLGRALSSWAGPFNFCRIEHEVGLRLLIMKRRHRPLGSSGLVWLSTVAS